MVRLFPVLALTVILVMPGCSISPESGDTDTAESAARPATWVGKESCVRCHRQQVEQWTGSHHDLAMQKPNESTVLGNFNDSTFESAGITSTFFRKNGEYRVRTDGPDGELHDYQVAYVFGVNPLQQYLIELPAGKIQALSISWDTRTVAEGGQRWFDLYPDETIRHDDELHWTGPNQNWNYMCAECHSTRLRKNYDPSTDSFATTWSEINVSCEACHGPASRHVIWAEAGELGVYPPYASSKGLMVQLGDSDDASWLFDETTGIAQRSPSRTSDVELETCARCHSRRSQFSEEYVHGQPLLQTHRVALMDEELYFDDGQIRDEVYVYGSFLQSLMHRRGVTCGDCHDPHSLELLEEGNTLCARCHLATRFDTPTHHFHKPDSDGSRCIACHMPSRTYMVVDPRRDHSFRIPRPDLTLEIGTPNSCDNCHAEQGPRWAASRIAEWYGPERAPHYGSLLRSARQRAPGTEAALAALIGDHEMPGIVRATAVELLPENWSSAGPAALEHALEDDNPLVRFSALRALDDADAQTKVDRAAPLLNDSIRLVRMEAGRVLAGVPLDLLSGEARRLRASAITEYRDSLEFNAERAESHVNLALLEIRLGDLDAAEIEYRKALELFPGWVPAFINLADLYRQQGRDDEGERLLRDAAKAAPNNADVHHSLGLLLARQSRTSEAIESLWRATELNSSNARYAYVYGVALQSAGRTVEALETLERAHVRQPNDTDIVIALTTMYRDIGKIEQALIHARELVELLPTNPEARRLLAELTVSSPQGDPDR